MFFAFILAIPKESDAIVIALGGGVSSITGGPITYTVHCGNQRNEICAIIMLDEDGGWEIDLNCNFHPLCGHHSSGIANINYYTGDDGNNVIDVTLTTP